MAMKRLRLVLERSGEGSGGSDDHGTEREAEVVRVEAVGFWFRL